MGLLRVCIGSDRSPMPRSYSGVSTYVVGLVLVFLEINTAYHCVSVRALQCVSKCDQVDQSRHFHPGHRHYCARYPYSQNCKVRDSSHRMQSEPYVPHVCHSSVGFLSRRVKILLILVGSTSAIQIVSQLLIWSLTLYKYVDLKRRSGWQTIPLLALVVRDGSWVFISISSKCFVKCQG